MACNCLERTLNNLKEKIKRESPGWVISDIDWKNRSWNSGKGNPINLYNEVKVEYTFTKFNGEKSEPKSRAIRLYGEYCIFCGKKFIED